MDGFGIALYPEAVIFSFWFDRSTNRECRFRYSNIERARDMLEVVHAPQAAVDDTPRKYIPL